MGRGINTQPASAEATNDNVDKKEEVPAKEPPAVRPFAVMRLTHEAIRSGMKDLQDALQSESSDMDDIKDVFGNLNRCIEVHAQQEDTVFFPLLNKQFENV